MGNFSRDVNIGAPFSGAARVAVRRRIPSTLCSIASQVRNCGRRLEREPVDGEDTGGRVFDGNPQPAFFVWRGVFLDKSTAAAGGGVRDDGGLRLRQRADEGCELR